MRRQHRILNRAAGAVAGKREANRSGTDDQHSIHAPALLVSDHRGRGVDLGRYTSPSCFIAFWTDASAIIRSRNATRAAGGSTPNFFAHSSMTNR